MEINSLFIPIKCKKFKPKQTNKQTNEQKKNVKREHAAELFAICKIQHTHKCLYSYRHHRHQHHSLLLLLSLLLYIFRFVDNDFDQFMNYTLYTFAQIQALHTGTHCLLVRVFFLLYFLQYYYLLFICVLCICEMFFSFRSHRIFGELSPIGLNCTGHKFKSEETTNERKKKKYVHSFCCLSLYICIYYIYSICTISYLFENCIRFTYILVYIVYMCAYAVYMWCIWSDAV